MAVQLMQRSQIHTQGRHPLDHPAPEFLSRHSQSSRAHNHSHQESTSSSDLLMAQSCLHQSRMGDSHEEPRYENLDSHGQAYPTDTLMDQFPDIQPAYITMLSRMTDAECTESVETNVERPPAPLPVEGSFLDTLVQQKLQTQKPSKVPRSGKQTPTAAVQRQLGYEDTDLSGRKHVTAAQTTRQSSPEVACTSASSAPTSPAIHKPRPKARPSAVTGSTSPIPPKSPGSRSPGLAKVSSSITPPTLPKSKSTSSVGHRPLLKFEGVHPTEWFHGVITRKAADDLLRNAPVGSFLVRIGERHLGYSLSVRGSAGLKHFMITQRADTEFQLGTNPLIHESMFKLIDHFHHNPLNNSGDTLSAALNYATALLK